MVILTLIKKPVTKGREMNDQKIEAEKRICAYEQMSKELEALKRENGRIAKAFKHFINLYCVDDYISGEKRIKEINEKFCKYTGAEQLTEGGEE